MSRAFILRIALLLFTVALVIVVLLLATHPPTWPIDYSHFAANPQWIFKVYSQPQMFKVYSQPQWIFLP